MTKIMFKFGGLQVVAIVLALLASFAEVPRVASDDLVKTLEKAAGDAATSIKDAVSPPPQTFSEKLKDSWDKAGQTLQGFADQVSAQLPKRSRREATGSIEQSNPRPNPAATDGSGSLDAKLDSARQLVQKIRERCVSGLENQRQQSQERSSSSESLAKLGELTNKVKNKTSDAREVLKNIRVMCAEVLANQRQPEQVAAIRTRRQVSAPPASAEAGKQQAPVASLFSNGQAALNAFGEQVRNQTASAVQQFQSLRDQLVPQARNKRQIQYPNLQQQQQSQPQAPSSPMNSAMKYISDLGQQAQQAQAISQFVQAATQQSGASPATGAGSSSSANVAQVLTQLTDLIKSTQNRNERLLENGQRSLESANQQTMEAAKSAQTGVQAALGDLTAGLQRLASNNPNLVPDIKSLYQSVSSKLSSSSSSSSGSAPSASGQLNQSPAGPSA